MNLVLYTIVNLLQNVNQLLPLKLNQIYKNIDTNYTNIQYIKFGTGKSNACKSVVVDKVGIKQ